MFVHSDCGGDNFQECIVFQNSLHCSLKIGAWLSHVNVNYTPINLIFFKKLTYIYIYNHIYI
jgi:hypothetical protein